MKRRVGEVGRAPRPCSPPAPGACTGLGWGAGARETRPAGVWDVWHQTNRRSTTSRPTDAEVTKQSWGFRPSVNQPAAPAQASSHPPWNPLASNKKTA